MKLPGKRLMRLKRAGRKLLERLRRYRLDPCRHEHDGSEQAHFLDRSVASENAWMKGYVLV